jgi:hypothetical protein
MPQSLVGFDREPATAGPIDAATVAALLGDGDVEGAMGAVALARLGGRSVSSEAAMILRHMAERPLLRSKRFGAFAAALLDQKATT